VATLKVLAFRLYTYTFLQWLGTVLEIISQKPFQYYYISLHVFKWFKMKPFFISGHEKSYGSNQASMVAVLVLVFVFNKTLLLWKCCVGR
jgi:hypothetical protein